MAKQHYLLPETGKVACGAQTGEASPNPAALTCAKCRCALVKAELQGTPLLGQWLALQTRKRKTKETTK